MRFQSVHQIFISIRFAIRLCHKRPLYNSLGAWGFVSRKRLGTVDLKDGHLLEKEEEIKKNTNREKTAKT